MWAFFIKLFPADEWSALIKQVIIILGISEGMRLFFVYRVLKIDWIKRAFKITKSNRWDIAESWGYFINIFCSWWWFDLFVKKIPGQEYRWLSEMMMYAFVTMLCHFILIKFLKYKGWLKE